VEPQVIEVKDRTGTRAWTLTLLDGKLVVAGKDILTTIELAREEFGRTFELYDGLLLRRTVSLIGSKKLFLHLEPVDFETFVRWLRPIRKDDVAAVLRRRRGFLLPIGILLIFVSAPVLVDTFDPFSLGLGCALVLHNLLARFAPHRALLLLEAGWMLAIAADAVVDVAFGLASVWWLLFALWVASMLPTPLKLYRFLRPGP
jgi:hypothetical protein